MGFLVLFEIYFIMLFKFIILTLCGRNDAVDTTSMLYIKYAKIASLNENSYLCLESSSLSPFTYSFKTCEIKNTQMFLIKPIENNLVISIISITNKKDLITIIRLSIYCLLIIKKNS